MGIRRTLIRCVDAVGLRPTLVDLRNRVRYAFDRDLRKRNAEIRAAGLSDGFPVPPPYYIYLITRHFDIGKYYLNGEVGADSIASILESAGRPIQPDWTVLDLGCGCGRVIRVWRRRYGGRLFGVDLNEQLIHWSREHLPVAEFRVNQVRSPLDFPDETFDLVYAVSVFTHLDEEHQDYWIEEIRRVLKPGGSAYITTRGPDRLEYLNEEERERFERGELVVQGEKYPGDNTCGAYHPESYVRRRFSRGFEITAYQRLGARDVAQDAYLLRRT